MATGTSNTFTLTIKNTGSDKVSPLTVTIPKIQIEANGSLKNVFFDSIIASGGVITGPNGAGAYTVTYSTLNPSDERVIELKLRNPIGVIDQKTFKVQATLSGSDDQCGTVGTLLTHDVTVQGLPVLRLFKQRTESLIVTGGTIHYKLTAANTSITPTRRSIVVDAIPEKSIFERAYTSRKVGLNFLPIKDDAQVTYFCR